MTVAACSELWSQIKYMLLFETDLNNSLRSEYIYTLPVPSIFTGLCMIKEEE